MPQQLSLRAKLEVVPKADPPLADNLIPSCEIATAFGLAMTLYSMRFRTFFLVFLLAELISYTGYFFPALNTVGFFVLVAAALALSLRRLEYGLYFVLADLILGGKSGALFSFQYEGFFLSLRMALFITVMGVWLGKVISACVHNPSQPPLTLRGGALCWWGLLGTAVVWGMVV